MLRVEQINAGVAQLVEQLIRNQQVAGSSPAISSKTKGHFPVKCPFFFLLFQQRRTNGDRESHQRRRADGQKRSATQSRHCSLPPFIDFRRFIIFVDAKNAL